MSILAVIEVDDQGTMKLVQYGNALDEVAGKERETAKQGEQTERQNKETANSFGELADRVGGLITSLVTLAGAGVMGELLKESAEIAARTQTLGIVMGITAKNAGATSAEYAIQVEKIKALGITTQEATNSVLQFAQADLKVADAAKVARVAQDLAVVAGMNSSQAFQTLTAAIGSQHTLLLRQFGIVTGLTEIYGDYAKSLGKTVNQLDEYEKKQAFVNKIVAEGEKVTGSYEAAMGSAGKQLSSMARFVEEAKEKLGTALLPVMFQVVTTVNHLLEAFAKLDEGTVRLLASLAAGVAVITLIGGAFAALSAIGLIAWLGAAVTAVTELWFTLAAGETVITALGVAFGGAFPWLGLITVGLGLATAAWVYFSSKVDESGDSQRKAAAEAGANIDKLNTLSLSAERTAETVGDATEQQKQYHEVAEKIIKISPGQVEALHKVKLSYEEIAEAALHASEEEKARIRMSTEALITLRAAKERDIETDQKALDKTAEALTQAKTHYDQQSYIDKQAAEYDRLETKIKGARAAVKGFTQSIEEQQAMVDPLLAQTRAHTAALELRDKFLKDNRLSLEQMGAKAKQVAVDMQPLEDATSVDTVKNALRAYTDAWDQHEKKVAKAASAEKTAFDSMMATMEGNKKGFQSQLNAIQEYFNKTSMSTEDWYSAVDRAKGPLSALAKSTEEVQNKYSSLMPMVWSLPTALTETEKAQNAYTASVEKAGEQVVKFGLTGEKAIESLTLSFEQGQVKLQQALAEGLDKSADKILATRQKLDDSLEKRSVELNNRETKGTLTALEEKLKANNDWYNAQQMALDKEIENLDKLQKAEEDAINKKALDRSRDVADTMAKLVLKHDQEARALEETIANELRLARAKREIKETEKEQDTVIAMNRLKEIGENYHTEIMMDQEGFRQRAQQAQDAAQVEIETARTEAQSKLALQLQAADKERDMIAAQRKEIERIRAISNGQILKEDSVLYDALKKFPAEFMGVVSSSLSEIVQGHKTLKEGILDIWKSIQNEITNVFSSIVKKWAETWVQMAMAGRAGSSGLAGMFANFGGGSVGGTPKGDFVGPQLPQSAMSSVMGGIGGGVMGGGIGMAIGGMAGANGSATMGGLAGAASGAGSGAAMGAMMGGPIGAGVGALVGGVMGLIGGIKAAHEAMKKMGEDRAAFVEAEGGLAALKTKADAAGISIDTLMNTKKPKEFTAELQKVQDALKLQGAKDAMVANAGGMEKLTKNAALAGYEIKKLFDTKNAQDFNAEVLVLNKALEQTAKTLKAGQDMAGGLAQRVAGSQETLTKSLTSFVSGLSTEVQKALTDGFDKASKDGFKGDLNAYTAQTMRGPEAPGTAEDAAKFTALAEKAQKAFNAMGVEAQISFATILKSSGDMNLAMQAVGPSLDALIAQQDQLGLHAEGGLQKLLDFRKTVTTNSDVATSLGGINTMLKAMNENGFKSQEMFSALGTDAATQMATLTERGVSADQALMMMQPTLQSLWEAQQKFGYETDETTQAMIDQGVQQGIVGEGMQSTNDKMLDILVLIGKALGATIPEAYDKTAQAAKATAKAQEKAAVDAATKQLTATNDLLNQNEDAQAAQKVLTGLVDKYGQQWVDDNPTILAQINQIKTKMADITHATEGVSGQLDTNSADFIRWREGVEREAGKAKSAVEGVAVGHSPGGVREISTQLGIATRAMQVFSTVAQSESKDAEAALKGVKPGASSRQSDTPVTGADLARLIAAIGAPQPVTMTLDGRVVSETVLKRMPNDIRLRGVNL